MCNTCCVECIIKIRTNIYGLHCAVWGYNYCVLCFKRKKNKFVRV